MSFLAPLFLAGAAAIVLPVVFHLIRRSPRSHTVFSSLMFLSPSAPKVTRRSRLDHLLLLLLRCAVLCLLAMAFARPFLRLPMPVTPSGEPAGKSILLLDVSASMQRDGLWAAARDRVSAFVTRSAPTDQVALYTFDQQLHPLVTFDEWNATPAGNRAGLMRSRLADTRPGWAATALDQAVIQGAALLAEGELSENGANRQVIVMTDLQIGSQTADLQTHEWPKDISVRTERLAPRTPGNASLEWLPAGAREDDLAVRLRIRNAPDSVQEQFQVGWAQPDDDGFAAPPVSVYVPAGQSRVLSLPSDGALASATAVVLTGDGQPFDNRVFVIPPVQEKLRVLYLGKEADEDNAGPLFFLRRAFPDTANLEIEVTVAAPEGPLPIDHDSAALVVALDTLSDGVVQQVHESLQQGGTLLFAAGDGSCAPSVARLMGVDALSMTEAKPRDYAMLANIDYRHPLFAPFADERFSDFTGIHFWKYRRIDPSEIPDARVLARFDSGDPAVIEATIGQGRLILLTSGWVPADSQLALSSKFVPLLFSLLELGGRATPPRSQLYVGEALDVAPNRPDATAIVVEGPEGKANPLDAGMSAGLNLTQPGLYTLRTSASQRQLAVNLHPREGRTAPLPADELERMGVPGSMAVADAARAAQRQVELHNAELEARQKLWHWLLITVLILLLAETWLAGRSARRVLPAKGVAG